MSADSPRVFISYRRDDAGANAGRLFDWLVRQFGGKQVFLDTSRIALGDDFEQVLRQRLGQADVVLVVIGPRWLDIANAQGRRLDQTDDYVRMEVAAALAADKRIIPVLVGGASMPAADDLPEVLGDLSRHNAAELRDAGFEQDFDQLVNAILGRPRGYLKTEFHRLQRLLRAIRLSSLLVPAVTVLVVLALWIGLLDLFTLDTRAASYLLWAGEQLSPAPDESGVLLVTIDADTERVLQREFGATPAWRRDHARLIERATAAGATAVVFDLFFERETDADQELADAVRRARAQGTRVVFGARARAGSEPRMIAALRDVSEWGSVCISRRLGYTYLTPLAVLDSDDSGQSSQRAHTPALALTAARAAPLTEVDIDHRRIRLDGVAADRSPQFSLVRRISGQPSNCRNLEPGDTAAMLLIRFAAAGYWQAPQRTLSYVDALSDMTTSTDAMHGRVVLVGATLPRLGDRYRLTSGLSRRTVFGMELHANAIANLLQGREVVTPTLDASAAFALFAAVVGAVFGFVTAPWPRWRRRLALGAVVVAYTGLATTFASQGYLLNVLYHATAFLFTFVILHRLRNGNFDRTAPTALPKA